jgi:hypothetical protein
MAFNSESLRYRWSARWPMARIGQLLGKAENHGPTTPHRDERLLLPHDQTRSDYRLLARVA